MSNTRESKLISLGKLIDTLDILRVKCPWDAKQTNESLRPNTVEETYELVQALMDDDADEIKKELGDVLLHILFYSKIADEQARFDLGDVAEALNDKLIYRHPHVFGETKVNSTRQVLDNWEQLKQKEKGRKHGVLGGVPSALPALIKAFRIQEKAAHVGFDWERPGQVWDKVDEEKAEVLEAIAGSEKTGTSKENDTDTATTASKPETGSPNNAREHLEEEFGDLFFSLVNAARLYGINPENALERTNRKFIRRFNHVEARADKLGKDLRDMSLDELDRYWEEAKDMERKNLG